MKCCLAPGVSIFKISEFEILAGGNKKVVNLQGPSDILLWFLKEFSNGNECDIGHSIELTTQYFSKLPAHEIRAGLLEVSDKLLDTNILMNKDKNSEITKYKRIIFITHRISAGLQNLITNKIFKNSTIYIIGDESNYVFTDNLQTNHEIMDFPGWNELQKSASGQINETLYIALGLTSSELHKFNKIAVELGLQWLYAAPSGKRVAVSPIYARGKSPCFACARLRRLSSVNDMLSNSAFEANLIKSTPEYETYETLDAPTDLMLAGIILGKLENQTSNTLHLIDKTTLEISQAWLTKLVDCPICG